MFTEECPGFGIDQGDPQALPEQDLLFHFGKLLHQADHGLEQMIQMPWSGLGDTKGQVKQAIAQRSSNCMQSIG